MADASLKRPPAPRLSTSYEYHALAMVSRTRRKSSLYKGFTDEQAPHESARGSTIQSYVLAVSVATLQPFPLDATW